MNPAFVWIGRTCLTGGLEAEMRSPPAMPSCHNRGVATQVSLRVLPATARRRCQLLLECERRHLLARPPQTLAAPVSGAVRLSHPFIHVCLLFSLPLSARTADG